MYNTALFDLDGVVLDTESQYTECWNEMGKEYKPEIDNFAYTIKGQTLVRIFEAHFKGQVKIQEEIKTKIDLFEKGMVYDYIPGFVDFIQDLKAHRVHTAIVTSSNQEKMEHVYKQHPELSSYFDVILTSEDFTASKPAPDGYLLAAEKLNVSHSDCMVFEDSINGIKAGKAALMTVCGLATTHPAETIGCLSDIVIDNFVGMNYRKFCTMG